MTAPESPTYLCHPMGDAASTASRFLTEGEMTESRYSLGCCSNNSQDGMLTTRLGTFSLINCSYAPRTNWTSEPVPMRMILGFLEFSASVYAPLLVFSAD